MVYRYRRRKGAKLFRFLPLFLLLAALLSLSVSPSEGSGASEGSLEKKSDVVADVSAEHRGSISLYDVKNKMMVTLPLEEYIIGVVAAEMPSDFQEEALKAQAVIARTYACWKMREGSSGRWHGDLCNDPGHCQAYYDLSALRSLWGDDFNVKYQRFADAANATAGMILTYNEEIAETYYHSTCGGKTASAGEVWGEDIPYLQSVTCKWDKNAPRYRESKTLSLSELPWLLGDGISPCIAVSKGENVSHIPVASAETESGRVQMVSYAGLIFEGTDFRNALELNSTRFTLESEGDVLTVTTYGFGHGVGLCQYGANGMAEQGYSFDEILSHYYTDTELKKIY